MASRTQIVCLCEGKRGGDDAVFINTLMKALKPAWVRFEGSNVVRLQPCGGRSEVIKRTAGELKNCLAARSHTTLMVWADCDDNCADGEALKNRFWQEVERQNGDEEKRKQISKDDFNRVVFIFAKDRLENWIEFLTTGSTDELSEGPRVKHDGDVAQAARKLAGLCKAGKPVSNMPPSLKWSCDNWRALVGRMQRA